MRQRRNPGRRPARGPGQACSPAPGNAAMFIQAGSKTLPSGSWAEMPAKGRALMSKPRLLLLDAPSLGLAPLVVHTIFQAIDEIKKNTRQYAKRQLTWFRKDKHYEWIDVKDLNVNKI